MAALPVTLSDACQWSACCDTGKADDLACWNVGACGCKVVAHRPHTAPKDIKGVSHGSTAGHLE